MIANALQLIGYQGRIFEKSLLKCSSYREKGYFYPVTKNKNMRHVMPAASLLSIIDTEAKKLNGAPFTVKSKKTGKDYTFKITQSPYMGKNYVHVHVEVEYLNFKYLGYYRNGNLVRKGGQVVDTPSALAASWLLRQVRNENLRTIEENVEVYHLGNCCKCGKTLTDAQSIRMGIGPKCGSY